MKMRAVLTRGKEAKDTASGTALRGQVTGQGHAGCAVRCQGIAGDVPGRSAVQVAAKYTDSACHQQDRSPPVGACIKNVQYRLASFAQTCENTSKLCSSY